MRINFLRIALVRLLFMWRTRSTLHRLLREVRFKAFERSQKMEAARRKLVKSTVLSQLDAGVKSLKYKK